MRVAILGVDGYLGWPLACHLMSRGHEVFGCDIGARRAWVRLAGGDTVMPIADKDERFAAARSLWGCNEGLMADVDVTDYHALLAFLEQVQPDTIVHLAEQPSAAFSMPHEGSGESTTPFPVLTQRNNVLGSLNVLLAIHELNSDIHLVKLGSMGVYGTPDCPIPEGVFPDGSKWWYRPEGNDGWDGWDKFGSLSGMPFPMQPGSFYHLSKAMDSLNVRFCCRTWGLRATDVMQGVVYGTRVPAIGQTNGDPAPQAALRTRLDIDQCFGTVINRFVAQAIVGMPLTVYGEGHQKRGFLPIVDSMNCLTLFVENPPDLGGEYRVANQLEAVYDITDLAKRVCCAAVRAGLSATWEQYPNPRIENENHDLQPACQTLLELGYVPAAGMDEVLDEMFADLMPHAARIKKDSILPTITWDGSSKASP